jgi:hypothetical protein
VAEIVVLVADIALEAVETVVVLAELVVDFVSLHLMGALVKLELTEVDRLEMSAVEFGCSFGMEQK